MKFESSKYSKIWDSNEGRLIVEAILRDPNLIKSNHTFWTTKFRVDPQITPTNQQGEAVFKSTMRQMESGVLMDMRAPLGDSTPMDVKGVAAYTGVIPDFITKGTVEKATERYYKEQLYEQFGDARLIAAYATDVLQQKVDSANQTLSHMAAYLLSHGNLAYLQGEGIHDNLYKAAVPAENFDTAGEKVWTDTTARILDQMVAKEEKYKELWGAEFAMQWEMTRKTFNECFLKNEQVIEWVRYVNVINNTPLPEKLVINEEMAMNAIAKFAGISPIVIIEEKQKDVNNGVVSGWKANTVVLRPAGYAGLIRHTTILDSKIFAKYANSVNSYNFTKTLNGLLTIMNSVVVNGNFKEWHTDGMLAAIPTLDEFLYHVIIDISKADA